MDLRHVYYRTPDQDEVISKAISSVRFTTNSIAGNIGAPLDPEDSSWITGAGDYQDSVPVLIFSEDPITEGISDDARADTDSSTGPSSDAISVEGSRRAA